MTYINPEVYNWKDLKDDDATVMRGYNFCIEDVETACDNITDNLQIEFRSSETVSKIVTEICEKFSEELSTWLDMQRTELTCSIMESNLDKYGEE